MTLKLVTFSEVTGNISGTVELYGLKVASNLAFVPPCTTTGKLRKRDNCGKWQQLPSDEK